MVESGHLQHDHDKCHDALGDAELQCALLAESQEADIVGLTPTQGTRGPVTLDWLASDLGHDVALAPEIFVAETQEVVDDEGFVTVADRVEVDVEVVVAEEKEADPGLESVNGDNEENPDDPSLLSGIRVESEAMSE